jgi:hypothetical protein
MSVLFLPPSAGAASVPDATELVSGKIRIATSAEATAGTNDLTAMTPAKTKSVVDAAVVGGVTYQGTFDASAPADLSNASKGDLYIISVAGTYQGQTWAVGDHLLINADMGGTLDPAKIDKVDNTDSVTSVAGRTGAVTLSTADISGLATVASTGAYSDLTGAPTLATVATTGAYSDLSGTPSLATVATTGAYSDLTGTPTLGTAAAEDVGTLAGNVVQLDGSARLPAVDGSQLTNLSSGGFTYQEQSTNAFNVSVTDSTNNIVMCSILGSNTTVLPASSGVADGSVVTVRAATATTLSISGGENIRNLGGSLVASVSIESGQNMSFVRASTSSFGTYWNQLTVEENTLNSLSDVNTSGAVATNVLKYDGTDWVDGAVAYSEVTGTPTLATVATTGAYSDLTGTPTLATVATTGAYSDLTGTPTLGTAAALDVGTSANNVVQLNGSAQLPAVDGSLLTGISASVAALNDIGDVSAAAPSDGDVIIYNSTSGDWEASALPIERFRTSVSSGGTVTAIDDNRRQHYDVTVSGVAVTIPNGGSSDVTGGIISVRNASSGDITYKGPATSWADGTQSGFKTLRPYQTGVLVWTSQYTTSEISNLYGTAAGEDVGTSANNVVQLNGSAQLPAVDGSLLTGITATVAALNDIGDVSAASPNNGDVIAYNSTSGDWEATAQSGGSAPSVTVSSPSTDQTLTSPSGIEEVYIYTPSASINVNLVAAATCGSGFKYNIKNRASGFTVTVDPDGSETIDGATTFDLDTQESAVTLVTDGSNWFII